MTNRAQATAAPTTVKLGGKKFLLSPMTDEDVGMLDRWVQNKHTSVARSTIPEDASDEQKDRTERIALMQASQLTLISPAGANILGSSIEGWAMIIWCAARKKHPETTPEYFEKILSDPDTFEAARIEWDRINDNEIVKRNGNKKSKRKVKKKIRKASKRRNR